MLPPPPRSTLFPYTTLFRSRRVLLALVGAAHRGSGDAVRAGPAVMDPQRGSRARLGACRHGHRRDRKSTRLNSSHPSISYAVFCLKKKKKKTISFESIPINN